MLEAARRGRETDTFELPLVTKDGERLHALLHPTGRGDAAGNAVEEETPVPVPLFAHPLLGSRGGDARRLPRAEQRTEPMLSICGGERTQSCS